MPSSVVRPRPEILKDLRKQIAKGRDIAESRYDEMEDALDDETKWDLYNLELLSQSFSGNQLVNEYRSIPLSDYDEESDEDEVADTHTDRMLARSLS